MHRFDTALGTCAVEFDDLGITRVHLPPAPPDRVIDDTFVPAHAETAAAAIVRLLDGEPVDLTGIPISHPDIDGFARRVYVETRRLGPGETTTYGAIARALGGQAGHARAVGAALAANPTPIIVPCHRVLAADGSLRGFSAPGGIATKRRLLEIERAPGFAQPELSGLAGIA